MPRDARTGRQDGFTLLEVLVALGISALIIFLAVTLYQTVLRAGETVRGGHRVWVAEQFLRAQAYEADPELVKRFGVMRGGVESFSFVTHKSAQFGDNGPPMFVTYRYDQATHALVYDEVPMPGWWRAKPGDFHFTYDDLRYAAGDEVWHDTLFSDLAAVRFSYWDGEHERWVDDLNTTTDLPLAVRLALSGPLARTIVLESAVSSLSSSSGSSPAAP